MTALIKVTTNIKEDDMKSNKKVRERGKDDTWNKSIENKTGPDNRTWTRFKTSKTNKKKSRRNHDTWM